MRNGQNKRMRGRNRKSQNPLTRVYESNGPDVKIRGTASHVADKYIQLARDAQTSGDPVGAENYYQHAEHYYRMIAVAQEQFRQANPYYRPETEQRDDNYEDGDDEGAEQGTGDQAFGTREPQPYMPREQGGRDQQGQGGRDQQSHGGREHQGYRGNEQQGHGGREHQGYGGRDQQHYNRQQNAQPQPQPARDNQPDGDGLPAFITGSGGTAPQQPPAHQGGGQQEGYNGQGDRFPLHRRRRRHRGPRSDQPGGGHGMASDGPDDGAPGRQRPNE